MSKSLGEWMGRPIEELPREELERALVSVSDELQRLRQELFEAPVTYIRDPEHPERLPTAYNYELQGTGYDRDAVGYERVGRKQHP
jgi:hypothetical protein